MSAEEDARARRDAWIAAGAPDYNAPTRDSGGNVTGYESVASQPATERSHDNDNLPSTMAWLGAGAPDYNAPIRDAAGNITGYQSVTATPVLERSLSNQNLEGILAALSRLQGASSAGSAARATSSTLRPASLPTSLPGAVGAGLGSMLPAGLSGQSGSYADLMSQIQRRSALLGFMPEAGKSMSERALAAIYANEPKVQQLHATGTWDLNNWQQAVSQFLAGADPVGYAVEKGYIAKPAPRTVAESVDARTLEILRGQGLIAPELEAKMNAQLATNADLADAGQPVPELTGTVEGSRFLPPIPSLQMWNGLFNAGERQGTSQLFGALGLLPSLLTDQISRLAPPGGGSMLATLGYRRR